MKPVLIAGLILASALATGASAQVSESTAGIVAAGAEGIGQGLGMGVTNAASVFVTATGRAELPPGASIYVADVQGKAATAVEAARLRDQKLAAARAIARRFDASVEIGASSVAPETAANPHVPRPSPAAPGNVVKPVGPPPEPAAAQIVAQTGVRFRVSDPAQLPAFLDALRAAGIDYALPGKNGALAALLGSMAKSGGGPAGDEVDEAGWDSASRNAIAEARRQAGVLASAAGRQLGEAQQILQITRTAQGDGASVTVAVRFGLLPIR